MSASSTIKDFLLMSGEWIAIFVFGLVIGVMGILKRQNWSFKWTAQREQRFVEQHTRIHEMLTELRVTIRACRCLVFQFHNGGAFADGSSMKKFSVTHESCDGSVASMILDSQDVLLTRYTDLIRIMHNEPSKILNTDNLPPSPFRSALEINNVAYFTVTPLQCADGITPLGFVSCHWCSSTPLDDIEKEGVSENGIEQVVENSVHEINTYLAYKTGKK